MLTVLVDYSDIVFSYSDASFQLLIYGASSSVTDYFLDNSYGGFTIAAATESWGTSNDGIIHVLSPKNHPDQGGDIPTSREEAREIVALADANIDYSIYDTDSNGVISPDELSIVIILAGYENSWGGDSALTPRVWELSITIRRMSKNQHLISYT